MITVISSLVRDGVWITGFFLFWISLWGVTAHDSEHDCLTYNKSWVIKNRQNISDEKD